MYKLCALVALSASSVFASACLPGTLQGYINLGATGCQAGNLTFADFGIFPGQSFATPINPQSVQVTPGGTADSPSLLFTLNQSALAAELFESFFRFDVTGSGLTGAAIELISPAATGDGAVIGVLDVCAGGLFAGGAPIGCSGAPGSAIAFAIDGDQGLTDSLTFSSSSFFDVFVDLTADGGLDGTATLNSSKITITSTPQVAPVPEPSTVSLTALALIFAGAIRARRTF